MSSLITMGGIGACALLLSLNSNQDSGVNIHEFLLTEMAMPNSYDPLEADYSNNLHASQMMYRSILEVGADNALTSGVLDKFSYDPGRREISLTVGKQATFNDGTAVTANDVALTIKRMILRRPQFPILKYIVGVDQWIKLDKPLEHSPDGISVVGDVIRIQLSKDVKNPLFRFALPLYGVVSVDCVDHKSNALLPNCKTSGLYVLTNKTDQELSFSLRSDLGSESLSKQIPKNVKLKYSPKKLTRADLSGLEANDSFLAFTEEGSDDRIQHDLQADVGLVRVEQPTSRFSVFQLNPQSGLFKDFKCRQQFAAIFREELKNALGLKAIEGSVFSRILPGYMTSEELGHSKFLDSARSAPCREFNGQVLRWMPQSSSSIDGLVYQAVQKTCEELRIKLVTLPEANRSERFLMFTEGKLDILMAASGFWAFDPVGDIQMLFTPGLHKPLEHISGDPKLQTLLDGLEFEADPSGRMRTINEYLYSQALFNVFGYTKRVYVHNSKSISDIIPIAITPPAPWQLFNASK